MKSINAIAFVGVALATAPLFGGWNLDLTRGWRLTGGAEFGGPVDANFRTIRGTARGPITRTESGLSREEAKDAVTYKGVRLDLPGVGFIDPTSEIEEADLSWNWKLPVSSISGTVGDSPYREVTASERSIALSADGDGANPGVSLELSRELWSSQELTFGVDFAFGLAWSRKSNLVRAGGPVYERNETANSGSYALSLGNQEWMTDPWLESEGGMYGVGNPQGPGPVMDLTLLGTVERGPHKTTSGYLECMNVSGDWEEWDLRFMMKPWWDVTDWLRLYGTLGVEVARTHFGLDVSGTAGSWSYGRRHSYDKWQVNGLGGGGVALRWSHLTMGVDFLARFLQQEIKVDDAELHGRIDRQPWLFRVYAGVDF